MTEPKRNLLGIPISGEIRAGSTRVEQYPQSQFEDIVRRMLDEPFFVDFGWVQYTPYFNDGDPCEFSADSVWVRTVRDVKLKTVVPANGDGPEEDDFDDEDLGEWMIDSYSHPTLGRLEYPDGYWTADMKRNPGIYAGDHEPQFRLAKELNDAVEEGHFENVLLDLFGDHCRVKVTPTGITINEYSHD